MSFDWNDFLTLAHDLAAKIDDASQRSAISRAYYCVFNLASARAESKVGPRPRGVPTHQWCWEQYLSTPDLTCRQLGVAGDRMKRMRVMADYKAAEIPRLQTEVQRMLQDAHQLLTALAALDPQYPRP